ncbi:MAG TPA: inositol monophosphatase family protein [Bryobacteraceae bacterium]|nr:inositol monophosphatase family protein [Bryobacteraceae bacterium]HUJ22177.1 inositol monophosphatase family protein [Bryobacteraceae bacterium]
MASYLETAVEIAREAGALLAVQFERRLPFETKGEYDLVTDADRASERLIVERLTTHFPSHAIVAEEGGGHDSSSEYRWYVDPLDGTTNFAHSFPCFNVTLALEISGELVAGVVFDPIRGELFTAERGSGAYLNHRRIRVSKVQKLENALVATGFPSRKRHLNVNVHFYHQLGMLTHGVRRCGSAAIDLAYVASGRLDAFWEFGLNPWDMAAGLLLVAEAGGRCSTMRGEPYRLRGPNIVVDNGLLHDEILALFAEVFSGRYRVPLPQM